MGQGVAQQQRQAIFAGPQPLDLIGQNMARLTQITVALGNVWLPQGFDRFVNGHAPPPAASAASFWLVSGPNATSLT